MASKPLLVLRKTHTDRLDRALDELLLKGSARCAILVDRNGRRLASRGQARDVDLDALAALIAGSFATTREMARLVGEAEFTVLFHQGEKRHIHNALIDDETILSVLFDERTTLDMIRLTARHCGREAAAVMAEARSQAQFDEPDCVDLDHDTQERLDYVFGGGDPRRSARRHDAPRQG